MGENHEDDHGFIGLAIPYFQTKPDMFSVLCEKIGTPGRTKFSYMMGGYHDMIYVILFRNEALWGTPDSINSQSVLVETILTHHCWQNVQFDWLHCDCWLYIHGLV